MHVLGFELANKGVCNYKRGNKNDYQNDICDQEGYMNILYESRCLYSI